MAGAQYGSTPIGHRELARTPSRQLPNRIYSTFVTVEIKGNHIAISSVASTVKNDPNPALPAFPLTHFGDFESAVARGGEFPCDPQSASPELLAEVVT
jgi:hypothetical protein